MSAPRPPQRVVVMPAYGVAVACFAVLALCLVTLFGGQALAERNAKRQLATYEADKVATANANRVLYCRLFGSQLDAFEDATSPAGQQSYRAWLDVYELARCSPSRR